MKNLKREQIAVSNFPYYKYSLEYTLASLERMGGKNIELYACDPHFHIDDVNTSDLVVLQRQLKAHGLKVVCFTPEQCIYPVNIANKKLAGRLRSLDVYRRCLELANQLECPTCQLLSGFGTLDEPDGDVWKRSADSLAYLAAIAEGYGITIALETSPKSYCITETSADMVRMIQEIGSPALAGIIDTAVLGYSGESMQQAIDILGPHLRHVHLGDGKPNGHLALGEGDLPLDSMLQALDDAAYTGVLSLEIMNALYVENPSRAMEKSFNWLLERIAG